MCIVKYPYQITIQNISSKQKVKLYKLFDFLILLNGSISLPELLNDIGIELTIGLYRHGHLFYIVPSKRNFVLHCPISIIVPLLQ